MGKETWVMIRCRLRILLAEREMSQLELSEKSSISRPTIGALFHNQSRMVSLKVLEAVCRVLKCQPGDLLQRDDDERQEE